MRKCEAISRPETPEIERCPFFVSGYEFSFSTLNAEEPYFVASFCDASIAFHADLLAISLVISVRRR